MYLLQVRIAEDYGCSNTNRLGWYKAEKQLGLKRVRESHSSEGTIFSYEGYHSLEECLVAARRIKQVAGKYVLIFFIGKYTDETKNIWTAKRVGFLLKCHC